MHPILDSLVATDYEWIKNLLFAFNAGDIAKFEALVPLLSREVRLPPCLSPSGVTFLTVHDVLMTWYDRVAHSARELRLFAPKDLSDGLDRSRLPSTDHRSRYSL